ncbi:hypothetical protein [Streptomyces collinus]|uniref:hypothetical protein n=1 Tax=Streptomyces collinus TaxID=42684 RepID=UPI0037D93F71
MDPDTQFVFGTHEQHGFVAAFTSSMPAHLAHWLLAREQFEPVPDQSALFRLAEPEHDGPRRTRQAVRDLRRQGYSVHADVTFDPATPTGPPRPTRLNRLAQQRSRSSPAAVDRSSQRGPAPITTPPSARPIPPKPIYAPTVRLTTWARRSR